MQLKKLPLNTRGRDFVVGDIHGMYALLYKKLASLGFNYETDRLISAGDLVDRGPDSFEVLKLLEKSWFFPVLGNHDGMLLTWGGLREELHHSTTDFLMNGGTWVFELTPREELYLRSTLLPLLDSVPLALHVDHAVLPFYVAHAERCSVIAPQILTDDQLNTITLNDEARFTWSRRMYSDALEAQKRPTNKVGGIALSATPWEPDVSLTYVGHSIVPSPVLHRSHLYLDCGGYKHPKQGHLHIQEHGKLAKLLKNTL